MLFLPIGHDQTIRRFPWLTVALMVICTLLQIQRTAFGPSWKELMDAESALEQRGLVLLERMQRPALPAELEDDDSPLKHHPVSPIAVPPELAQADSKALLAAVSAGKLGEANDPGVLAYRAAEAELHTVQGRELVQRWGYRPSSGLSINLLLAAFVHGGFIHLAGNMLFLWLCGCNLEDRWGRLAFGGLYLVSAILSSAAYGLVHRGSDIPLVGASGAIAGVMGAFLVCFHSAQIKYWWWWYFKSGTLYLPAYVAFPVWFLSQLGQSLLEVSGFGEVAYSAHVGGFVFGLLSALLIRFGGLERFLLPDDDDEASVEEPAPLAALARSGPGFVGSPSARSYSQRPAPRVYVSPGLRKGESNYPEDPAILRARVSSQPAAFTPMSHAPEIPAAPRLPDFGDVPDVAPWPPPFLAEAQERAVSIQSTAPMPSPLEALRHTLEADPTRDDVRYELCKIAIAERDPEQVDLTATRSFLWLAEQERWTDIVSLYDAFVGTTIDRPLSDRAYSMIVRAAVETNDPKLCVSSAQKMANTHPTSPLLPRALWDVGNAQERGGRADFARKTFTMLIERFPQHRFAEEARRRVSSG